MTALQARPRRKSRWLILANSLQSSSAGGFMRLLSLGALALLLAGGATVQAQSTSSPSREVTLPRGTVLPVVLDTAVGSDISRVEQPVSAHLARAVVIRGETVLPRGSAIAGLVSDAARSGKVK